MRIDRLKIFLDSMGGGAWPFLVGGVICQVKSGNKRDFGLLIITRVLPRGANLGGPCKTIARKFEAITGL